MCHVTEYAPSKTAEHLSDNRAVQNYQKFTFCEKDLKDNDINMIASIWREDILECKSLDIVNSNLTVFIEFCYWKTISTSRNR